MLIYVITTLFLGAFMRMHIYKIRTFILLTELTFEEF